MIGYKVVSKFIDKVIQYLVYHNTLKLLRNLLSLSKGRFSLFNKEVTLLVRACIVIEKKILLLNAVCTQFYVCFMIRSHGSACKVQNATIKPYRIHVVISHTHVHTRTLGGSWRFFFVTAAATTHHHFQVAIKPFNTISRCCVKVLTLLQLHMQVSKSLHQQFYRMLQRSITL